MPVSYEKEGSCPSWKGRRFLQKDLTCPEPDSEEKKKPDFKL